MDLGPRAGSITSIGSQGRTERRSRRAWIRRVERLNRCAWVSETRSGPELERFLDFCLGLPRGCSVGRGQGHDLTGGSNSRTAAHRGRTPRSLTKDECSARPIQASEEANRPRARGR